VITVNTFNSLLLLQDHNDKTYKTGKTVYFKTDHREVIGALTISKEVVHKILT